MTEDTILWLAAIGGAAAVTVGLVFWHGLRRLLARPARGWERGPRAPAQPRSQPPGLAVAGTRPGATFLSGPGVQALLQRLGDRSPTGLGFLSPSPGEEVLLAQAGLYHRLPPRQWRGIRLFFTVAATVGGAVAGGALIGSHAIFTAGSVGLLSGWLLPGFWLTRQKAERQERLRAALPALVDHLRLGLAGGLNVRQTISLTAAIDDSELAGLLRQVDVALSMGTALPAAVASVLELVEHGPVRLVLEGLVDAEDLGTQYADALQEQSQFVQALERQDMQRRLNALPLKLMITSLLFFMPTIFVIILVPNLLALFRSGW